MKQTLYKPEFCQILIEHMTQGADFRSFAGYIGVSRSTLYNWVEKHPAFAEAKELAWEKSYSWWEERGRTGLWITKDGPNINAGHWIRQMVVRFRDDWGKAQEERHDDTEDLKSLAEEARRLREIS